MVLSFPHPKLWRHLWTIPKDFFINLITESEELENMRREAVIGYKFQNPNCYWNCSKKLNRTETKNENISIYKTL